MEDQKVGRVPSEPGSRPSTEPQSAQGLGPSGFDPSREAYLFTNGWTMRREGPNHFWHLRDGAGGLKDKDRYRHDLIERWRLTVAMHHDPHGVILPREVAEGALEALEDVAPTYAEDVIADLRTALRDSDGSPKGGDSATGSVEDDSAGRGESEGIAQ